MISDKSGRELPRIFAALVRLHPIDSVSPERSVLASLVGDVWFAARSKGRVRRAVLASRLTLDLVYGAVHEYLRKLMPGGGRTGAPSDHDTPRAEPLGALVQDVRAALRGLRRGPAFTIASIGTLALGIAGVTTFWSVTDQVLLRPIPYPDADRMVRVWDNFRALDPIRSDHFAVSAPEYATWLTESRTIEDAAAVSYQNVTLEGGAFPLRVRAGFVTWNFFTMLGAEPKLGREFRPGENDPGADPVAILSDSLWRSEFASDPGIVGRTVRVDGVVHEIVGVAPADFAWLEIPEFNVAQPDPPLLWVPRSMDLADTRHFLQVLARARADVSVEEIAQDLGTLRALFSPTVPRDAELPEPATLVTVERLHSALYASVQDRVVLPLAAVTLLMLLACANVAHMLLGRLPRRRVELATRAALGASRNRLARQLMTEALVLAALAAIIGAAIAVVATSAVARLGPQEISRLSDVHVDSRALALSIVLAAFSAVLFGLAPAIRGAHVGSGQRHTLGGGRARAVLLSGQLAMALMLLTSAALVARSFSRLLATDLGIDPEGAVVGAVVLPAEGFFEDLGPNTSRVSAKRLLPAWTSFGEDLRGRLARETRVTDVGIAMYLQPGYFRGRLWLEEDGPEGPDQPADSASRYAGTVVGPGYFEAIGARVTRGRDFAFGDSRVAVVNESLARIYWPGQDPIGKRIRMWDSATAEMLLTEVVGVVADWRERGYSERARPTVFQPLADALGTYTDQRPPPISVVVRRSGSVAETEQLIRTTVNDMNPRAVVSGLEPLDDQFGEALSAPRFYALLFSSFGALALVIAVAGVFGTVASTVSERTREIGVRMALGGHAKHVVSTVVRQAALFSVGGVVVGAVGSWFASRLLRSLLYDVQSTDAVSLGLAVVVLLACAVTAAWLPAREAARVDPAVTLRAE